MITPAQQHWQNVMAQRAGRANEGVDHAARTAHEGCCIVCVWHRPGLRAYRPEARKPPSKELLPDFSGWIEERWRLTAGSRMK